MRPYLLKPRSKTLGLLPSDVARAYNFPVADVSNQTIAVIELGGAYKESDIYNYCDKYQIKRPNIRNYYINTEQESSPFDGEIYLDICVIALASPGVNIAVVFSQNTEEGFIQAIRKCIELGPAAISISYGQVETNWSTNGRKKMDHEFKRAITKNINVFCASGDAGSSDGYEGVNVDYPASSPYVIACGGTQLKVSPDGSRSSEIDWELREDGTGGGGGISKLYKKPSYQKGITLSNNRMVPDISGNADPITGYRIVNNGIEEIVGGTSAVSPLFSSLSALINSNLGRKVGFWNNLIYPSYPELCYDVTVGSNGAYNAHKVYDLATGCGVLDGSKLLWKLK